MKYAARAKERFEVSPRWLHRRKALGLGVRMSMTVSMSLDFAECDRARVARDPSYDGRFYTGVRTTGIYCRPVCPVRPARSANVSFFPSAAAAEAAGFVPACGAGLRPLRSPAHGSAAGRQLKERCG